ncbi:hypothetical protein ADK86_36845 [Streptomyces sp. NRRL F-5755]|nr:hypothetical protein ADK86_36845 [Streptomyces sp. NRRL F-5755]
MAALAGTAALASLFTSASAASAEPDPPGCFKGYFCMYSGENLTGVMLSRTRANWDGSIGGVRSVFNNGYRLPGADHVQFDYDAAGTMCIHYNPGPGQYKVNFAYPVRAEKVIWRGEC